MGSSSLDSEEKCPLCGLQLRIFAPLERQWHVNDCLDGVSNAQGNGKEPIPAGGGPDWARLACAHDGPLSGKGSCEICGKILQHLPLHTRLAHLRRCRGETSLNGVDKEGDIKKGTKRRKKAAPKRKEETRVDDELHEFLRSLGMGRYASALEKEGVNLETLRLLTEEELLALKIPAAGRKRISSAVPRLAVRGHEELMEEQNHEENDEELVLTQEMLTSRLQREKGRSRPTLWLASKLAHPVIVSPTNDKDSKGLDQLLKQRDLQEVLCHTEASRSTAQESAAPEAEVQVVSISDDATDVIDLNTPQKADLPFSEPRKESVPSPGIGEFVLYDDRDPPERIGSSPRDASEEEEAEKIADASPRGETNPVAALDPPSENLEPAIDDGQKEIEVDPIVHEKRWSGYSDEEICIVLREAEFYETILLRDHVELQKMHDALKASGMKISRAALTRFLQNQGVGWR